MLNVGWKAQSVQAGFLQAGGLKFVLLGLLQRHPS